MALRKKRMAFKDYEEALAKTEELAASGDQESDDFLAAAEAAAQFFLAANDYSRFNKDLKERPLTRQKMKSRKWLTLNQLLKMTGLKLGGNHDNVPLIVERQEMPGEVSSNELD